MAQGIFCHCNSSAVRLQARITSRWGFFFPVIFYIFVWFSFQKRWFLEKQQLWLLEFTCFIMQKSSLYLLLIVLSYVMDAFLLCKKGPHILLLNYFVFNTLYFRLFNSPFYIFKMFNWSKKLLCLYKEAKVSSLENHDPGNMEPLGLFFFQNTLIPSKI